MSTNERPAFKVAEEARSGAETAKDEGLQREGQTMNLLSQNVLLKWFLESQFTHKIVNFSL